MYWYVRPILIIGGILALCGLAVWVMLYTASKVREREREACAASSRLENNGNEGSGTGTGSGTVRGSVRAYAVRVDPNVDVHGMDPPPPQDLSVLASCGGQGRMRLVTARVTPESIVWLPLSQTREAIRLYEDVLSGHVRNLIIRGVVVRVWATNKNTSCIILGRLPTDDKALSVPKGCSPLPIATPFLADTQSASAWTKLVMGLRPYRGIPILLNVWAF